MRQHFMGLKMWMAALTAIALFAAWPAFVGAQETVIPPEAQWTPTPPARQTVDPARLVELLRAKGVITDQDYAQLTRPRSSSPAWQGHGRVWTWAEIDHNPVLHAGWSGGE